MNIKLIKIPVFFIILTLLFSCTKKNYWGEKLNWKEIEFSKLPSSIEYPDEGAIVLFDEGKLETFGDSESGFTVYEKQRIIKIFNPRGYRYASVAIPYTPRNDIENIQARTILPSGDIVVVKPDEIYDISLYPNFMLYSDQRAKIFTFPAIENGSVVEYRFNITYQGHTYGNSWNFQDNIPVLFSRFSIRIPSEAEPKYHTTGIDIEPQIKKGPSGFKSEYSWEVKNLKALKPEIGMPVRKKVAARLNIGSANTDTWPEIADWYKKLSQPQMNSTEKIKNMVARITKGVIDPNEKLKLIFEWVRDNIRYLSVSIGIGGYQPHAADDILFNRYGDCKDMTTLLCTMAKEADIDVYQALISTWQNGRADTTLASVSHFNHVVAFCPSLGESGIWMDATNKACPFGQLPWYDKDMITLLVKDDSSGIMSTPPVTINENRKLMEWVVALDSSGSALVEGKNMLWGSSANEFRNDLMRKSQSETEIWIHSFIAGKCALTSLDTFSIIGLYPIKDPLIFKYKFSTENFANSANGTLIFAPGDISDMNLSEFFISENRQFPIRFRYGLQTKMNLTIQMPEGWKTSVVRFDDTITSEFGNASWKWFVSRDEFIIQNEFVIEGKGISPEKYTEFKKYLNSIEKNELKEVVLIKK